MKFVDEFRNAQLGQVLAGEILAELEPGRHYKVMEVCGGHTHSIYKYGIDDLLPENVELVHGPGCPVCVIPMGRVDDGIALAHEDNVIFTCFGDMLRVPGSNGSLLDATAEGDVQGSLDADRLSALHVPVTQLNTDPGFGGECHLDANMVRTAIPSLALDETDPLVIENVGNLVCPAEFRVGEDVRAMISSVAEGEDKPLKYPLMFRACELVVVNKTDLPPHLDFSLERFLHNLDRVNPGV